MTTGDGEPVRMIKLLKTTAFVGPNPFAPCKAMRVLVDLGSARGLTLSQLEIADSSLSSLPALGDWARDGSTGQLTVGEVLARIARDVQAATELPPPDFAASRELPDGTTEIVYGATLDEVAKEAGAFSREWLRSLLGGDDSDPEFDLEADFRACLRRARRHLPGPSTVALLRAAASRCIPWLQLADGVSFQLGQGQYQQRIDGGTTALASQIAVALAADKVRSSTMLAEAGLPVPEQLVVSDIQSAETAAESLGWPLAVKPLTGTQGSGVSLGIGDPEQLADALDEAQHAGRADPVLLEQLIPGRCHRLLVVGGRLIGGIRTAAASESSPWSDQPEGDISAAIHPDNRLLAERAAVTIGLDIAAVEFVTPDISRSHFDRTPSGDSQAVASALGGGAICAVDGAPSLRPFTAVGIDAAGAVIDLLFPPGSPSRIPIAAVTGTNGKTTTARMLSSIMAADGRRVGLTSTDAVYLDGLPAVRGDMSGPAAARTVLRDPRMQVAVLETARGGIVRRGLGFDYCDVAGVLNVSEDHIGMDGIDSLQTLAEVKSSLVKVTRGTVVLNADCPWSLGMRAVAGDARLCLISSRANHDVVALHRQAGGPTGQVEPIDGEDWLVLYEGDVRLPLLATRTIPATLNGQARHNVGNALMAAAMGRALNASTDAIAEGLRRFSLSFDQAPGRLNIHDSHGFRVILDYGHNPAAMQAMVETVEAMAPSGKRCVVIMVPGDRRDSDVTALADVLAGHFDRYICKQNDDRRGRDEGEITALVRAALLQRGVEDSAIDCILDEQQAVDAALAGARPGDLVLIFGERTARCWQQIVSFQPAWGALSESG
jgi:cyanophycin synthetase